MAIAPSPVTLQAVPKLSMAIYKAIMSACMSASKLKTEASGPRAAMTAPPGTPGAATIQTESTKMKLRKSGKPCGIPLSIQIVRAQQVIFIIEPDRWMVAQRGTVNPAMPSVTPFFSVCFNVTGIVAADEEVPSAVNRQATC